MKSNLLHTQLRVSDPELNDLGIKSKKSSWADITLDMTLVFAVYRVELNEDIDSCSVFLNGEAFTIKESYERVVGIMQKIRL